MAIGPLETLPRRRFVTRGAGVGSMFDDLGFLSSEFLAQTQGIADLFGQQAVLVVAPPWTGKTFVAKQLLNHLRNNTEELSSEAPFGRLVHATLFETFGLGQSVTPPWWEEWRAGQNRGCWIVDALDEDRRRGWDQAHAILDCVEQLTPEERSRLFLLLFCRENEEPPEVRKRLETFYGCAERVEPQGLQEMTLAPLDPSSARDIVGSNEAFAKVCGLVTSNQLQSVSALPSVLETLKRQLAGASLLAADVWRLVLRDLLHDRREEQGSAVVFPAIHDRFTATSRMAAVLALSGQEEVSLELAGSPAPTIPDLLPANAPRCEQVREAAAAALKTGVFTRTATGLRFAQRHVQEWFAAFGLVEVPLSRLKALVTDPDGKPLEHQRGVLALLHVVTCCGDVRDWITASHHGVPPRSAAAPWTLPQALSVLDRLQELAKSTEHGLPWFQDRGLKNLAAPGLGMELAKRLADRALSVAERRLIVEVALAVSTRETVPAAAVLVRDDGEDEHLRVLAACLLRDLADDDCLRGLEEFVGRAEPTTRIQREVVSCLILAFYEHHLWSLVEAAQNAPARDSGITDITSLLEHRLVEQMVPQDARELLRTAHWPGSADDRRTEVTPRRESEQKRPSQAILLRAAQLLAEQDTPETTDYDLLLPIMLTWREGEWGRGRPSDLLRRFGENADARRLLFTSGLRQDPKGTGLSSWTWRHILTGEDVDWLTELAERQCGSSPWLWHGLLLLSYSSGVPQSTRNRVRRRVSETGTVDLATFDKKRQSYQAEERRRRAEQERMEEKRIAEQRSLPDMVRDTLDHPEMGPKQQMHRLSWFCFGEDPVRPTNITGKWEDLSKDLQAQVLKTCEQALNECEPTPIPDGRSFPGAIIHEACAFIEVLQSSNSFRLDREKIEKWLPATLVFTLPGAQDALVRCVGVDRQATDEVLLGAIRRELRSDQGTMTTAANLPAEFWSEPLLQDAVKLVEDDELDLKGRCDLLGVLAERAPASVRAVARRWVGAAQAEEGDSQAKRIAALDVLLAVDPETGMAELARGVEGTGKQILLQMGSLTGQHYWRLRANLKAWPAALLAQLGDLLYQQLPPEKDPRLEVGASSRYSIEDELRELRDRIPSTLLERGQPEDAVALGGLVDRHPRVEAWYRRTMARQDAGTVLDQISSDEGTTRAGACSLPVEKVVRVLEESEYRLIRSDGDLQEVLVEELTLIGQGVGDHLSMLYCPKSGRETVRKRLHEDALQAYLLCRLRDRLPGRVLEPETTVVFIDREPLAHRDQRLDLKVQAPTVEGKTATVVIEIKWSDNRKVSTSLTEQLGKRYLLDQALTKGIYFVGWCGPGHWRRMAVGSRPKQRKVREAWQEALEGQAREFARSHPEVKVVPLVVDLMWRPVKD